MCSAPSRIYKLPPWNLTEEAVPYKKKPYGRDGTFPILYLFFFAHASAVYGWSHLRFSLSLPFSFLPSRTSRFCSFIWLRFNANYQLRIIYSQLRGRNNIWPYELELHKRSSGGKAKPNALMPCRSGIYGYFPPLTFFKTPMGVLIYRNTRMCSRIQFLIMINIIQRM